MKKILPLALALCASLLAVSPGTAASVDFQPGAAIRAGIYVDPPITIQEEYGGHSGLAVELWEIVAKRMQVRTEYVVFDKFPEMLAATAEGDIDIAVHALGVNAKRASSLWYSFPWHLSAARIMTLEQQSGSFWAEFRRFRHFRTYGVFGLIFVVMVAAMTLLRRRLEKDFPRD